MTKRDLAETLFRQESEHQLVSLGYRRNITTEEFFRLGIATQPWGFCQCGCGLKTQIANKNTNREGYRKGVPRLFAARHSVWDRPRGAVLIPATGCWHWAGGLDTNGYAIVRVDGVSRRFHRWCYEAVNGPIPKGLQIDHLCRNRACVNPDHLEPVTGAINTRRGDSARLTEDAVRAIRAGDETQAALAERYGVTQTAISKVRRGETWGDVV